MTKHHHHHAHPPPTSHSVTLTADEIINALAAREDARKAHVKRQQKKHLAVALWGAAVLTVAAAVLHIEMAMKGVEITIAAVAEFLIFGFAE